MAEQPAVVVDDPRRWWGLAVLCVALCVVVIDNTVLNVALPTLRRALGASETDLQWITTAYALTLSGLLLPFGVLGDRIGRRGMLLAGLSLFGTASVVAAFTASPLQLSLARGAMGIGGAATTPSTLSILGNLFSDRERLRAIAIWAGVAGMAAAVGPVVGGLLLAHFWWGSVFLINAPVVVAGLAGTRWLLPRSRAEVPRAIDGKGSLLWSGALGLLLFAVIEGPVFGWTSAPVLAAAGAAAGLLVLFARQERRAAEPMLGPSDTASPLLRAGAVAIVGVFFALFGTQFTLTQWIQGPLRHSAVVAGLCFAPMALASVASAMGNPVLDRRFGVRRTAVGGLLVMAGGLAVSASAAWATGGGNASLAVVIGGLVLVGAGNGAAAVCGVELLMASVPAARAGSAAGVNETLVEAGGAVGVAVLGSTLAAGAGYGAPVLVAAGTSIAAAIGVAWFLRHPAAVPLAHP